MLLYEFNNVFVNVSCKAYTKKKCKVKYIFMCLSYEKKKKNKCIASTQITDKWAHLNQFTLLHMLQRKKNRFSAFTFTCTHIR